MRVFFALLFATAISPHAADAIEVTGFGIVQDEDGWSNVRAAPGSGGKILGRIDHGTLVFILETSGDWYSVSYQSEATEKTGYLHRSRIRRIEETDKIPVTSKEEKAATFSGHGVVVELAEGGFDPKGAEVTVEKLPGGEFVQKINGKPFFGTDGGVPRTRYAKFAVTQEGREVAIPGEATADLFEPNLGDGLTSVFVDRDSKTVIIAAFNSDGAGGYAVAFRITDGRYRGRLVFSGF